MQVKSLPKITSDCSLLMLYSSEFHNEKTSSLAELPVFNSNIINYTLKQSFFSLYLLVLFFSPLYLYRWLVSYTKWKITIDANEWLVMHEVDSYIKHNPYQFSAFVQINSFWLLFVEIVYVWSWVDAKWKQCFYTSLWWSQSQRVILIFHKPTWSTSYEQWECIIENCFQELNIYTVIMEFYIRWD